MKNILIIVPELSRGGGAEKIAGKLGYLFEQNNFNVKILTFYESVSPYEHSKKIISLNQRKGSGKLSFFRVFKRANEIKKICEKHNITTKISFLEDANFANILSSMMGDSAKTIISVRNNPEIYFKKSPFYANIMKKLYNKADLTVCVAKGVENSLKRNYKISNTKTISNMINTNRKENDKIKLKTKSPNILMIGRFIEQKGHKELFKTIEYMKTKPNIYILGDGNLKKELLRIKPNNVTFLEKTNNVSKFIKSADVVLSYSKWEGMSNIILEAINQNKPVITTDHKYGAREVLANITDYDKELKYPYKTSCGVLITPIEHENFSYERSAKELEEALEMIKTIKNPRKRVFDFDENKIIDSWIEII